MKYLCVTLAKDKNFLDGFVESISPPKLEISELTLDAGSFDAAKERAGAAALLPQLPLTLPARLLPEPSAAPLPGAADANGTQSADKLDSSVSELEAGYWGLAAVGALRSQGLGRSQGVGKGVIAAILDTGIRKTHQAFQGLAISERNFSASTKAHDEEGHGTHCAGTAFGGYVDGVQIGIAPGIQKLLVAKLGGATDTHQWIRALGWSIEQGAHLVVTSLAFDAAAYVEFLQSQENLPPKAAIAKAVYFHNQLCIEMSALLSSLYEQHQAMPLVIAASGNGSKRPEYSSPPWWPADQAGVLAVGAATANGTVLAESNAPCALVGPGERIRSAWMEDDRHMQELTGTSMAAPHVAGCAARWAERLLEAGQFSAIRLRDCLLTNTKPLENCEQGIQGRGLVQCP